VLLNQAIAYKDAEIGQLRQQLQASNDSLRLFVDQNDKIISLEKEIDYLREHPTVEFT